MIGSRSLPRVVGIRQLLLVFGGFVGIFCDSWMPHSEEIPQQQAVPPAAPAEVVIVEPEEKPNNDPDLVGSYSRTVSFSRNREMEIRLRGAQTAFSTGSSVDGVRILAELLALPGPHNIQIGSTLHDVRDEATRLLQTSSEEVREQFRRETEVRAAGELREAMLSNDYLMLTQVAARYPFTPTARECTEMMITQLNDHGDYGSVIQSAQRWIERSPDPVRAAENSPQLVEFWYSALRATGAISSAGHVAAKYMIHTESSPFRIVNLTGDAEAEPIDSPDLLAKWEVTSELPPQVLVLLRRIMNDLSREGVQPSLAMRPLVLADRVVWRSLTEIVCVQRQSGDILWRQPITDPTTESASTLGDHPDKILAERLRMQVGHRVLRNSIMGQLTSDGTRVYCIEQVLEAKQALQPEAAQNTLPTVEVVPIPVLRVVAYSLVDGAVQWKSDEVWGDESHGKFLFGPPVPHGKSLYSVVQQEDQLLLLYMDASTGDLDGVSVLGDAPRLSEDRRRMTQACPIVWHDGLAICATGAGAVVAFDISRDQLRWGFRHTRNDVEVTPGLPQLPMNRNRNGGTWMVGWQEPQLMRFGKNLIYASPETNLIRCLSADEGELQWEVPIGGARTLVGGDETRVVIAGNGIAKALRLEDGSVEREYAPPLSIASSSWADSWCQFVLRDGRRIHWNPASGESKPSGGSSTWEPVLAPAGSLRHITGEREHTLLRNERWGANQLYAQVNRLSMRPTTEPTPTGHPAQLIPEDLQWKTGDPQVWLRELTSWVTAVPDSERSPRIEAGLAELARSLESKMGTELPVDDWLPQWSLTLEQSRELTYLRLKQSLSGGQTPDALRYLFHLLEQSPEAWEVELLSARFAAKEPASVLDSPRTVRLDAVLRGALQELWDNAPPEQRTEIQSAFTTWSSLPRTQLDDLARPLEQLSFLPHRSPERAFQWTTLSELAIQQFDLRHRAARETGRAKASALWRLAEMHMARGDWGDAAGLIEQLQQQFGEIAIQGDQPTDDLVKSLPANSPVLNRMNRDRRTMWPDREPVVTSKESFMSPDQQIAIPIRADRGSQFDHVNVTYGGIGPSQLRFSGLGKSRSWTLSLPKSIPERSHRQEYPELRRGWAFGQFLVVQVGSELFCVSSLNTKGETSTVMKQESILWPTKEGNRPRIMIDTLGNEENSRLFHESRPVSQFVGFSRPNFEMFDTYGHRTTWVGPVSSGTLCFLQQGMLVCLETATGRELWRRYDMPPGVQAHGDEGAIILRHDEQSKIEILSPLDGRTLQSYPLDFRSKEILKHWGRLALVASGQPMGGTPVAQPIQAGDTSLPTLQAAVATQELRLNVVDLTGPTTIWDRTYPAGSAAFEIDEDWVGVLTSQGKIEFIEIPTGKSVSETAVEVPPGLTQIVSAVTERTIYVSLSPEVTEKRLVNTTQTQQGWRRPFVNGPVLAFDRLTGKFQWSQIIENRVLPLDQVRDIPLLMCVDVWKGPEGPLPVENETLLKRGVITRGKKEDDVTHTRYWCLDARTGKVILNTSISNGTHQFQANSGTPEYTVERDLEKGWIELRLGSLNHRFHYAPVEPPEK